MKFFVQCKPPDNSVDCGMFTGQQIIEMMGNRNITGCEYKVYDVSRFGETEMLTYVKPVLAQNVCTYDVMNASAIVMVEGAENVLNTMLA